MRVERVFVSRILLHLLAAAYVQVFSLQPVGANDCNWLKLTLVNGLPASPKVAVEP